MPTSSQNRNINGCWTCRLRRKKCDESRPVCGCCQSLNIVCTYSRQKPPWWDGGPAQEEMAEAVKREIKNRAPSRSRARQRQLHAPSCDPVPLDPATSLSTQIDSPGFFGLSAGRAVQSEPETIATLPKAIHTSSFSQSILTLHYLDNVVPLLFPFYTPSIATGGRAWILELVARSPVLREVMMSQSLYFFSIAFESSSDEGLWPRLLTQTKSTFETMEKALAIIHGLGMRDHLPGAVRVLAGVLQAQRFEIAINSFENCEAHFGASLALFNNILDTSSVATPCNRRDQYGEVLAALKHSTIEVDTIPVESAEQIAFRFSTSLLILDDIVASTMYGESPKLCGLYSGLDCSREAYGELSVATTEEVIGCHGYVLMLIGQISTLAGWKRACVQSGVLDIMELGHRASSIRDRLDSEIFYLSSNTSSEWPNPHQGPGLAYSFAGGEKNPDGLVQIVTGLWAHAAVVYLHVVTSGWQKNNSTVQSHAEKAIEAFLSGRIAPRFSRNCAWPICVAGCFADDTQQTRMRSWFELLPKSYYAPLYKALGILEDVWSMSTASQSSLEDIGSLFRRHQEFVLLV